ncbi:MAG: hypothetical protein AAF483_13110 [Planctomycetota bacterium]
MKRLILLWTGIVIGGSIIAAPAKFQVESLTRPVALQVGRAQFLWVTYAEIAAIIVIAVMVAVSWHKRELNARFAFLFAAALAIFAFQHLGLMPLLQIRSNAIIAGEEVGESKLHLVYVFAESIKCIILLVAGCLADHTLKSPK